MKTLPKKHLRHTSPFSVAFSEISVNKKPERADLDSIDGIRRLTGVQPEPTALDATRPQQLSPDKTWATPSIVKSKIARGSQASQQLPTRPTSRKQSECQVQVRLLVHQQSTIKNLYSSSRSSSSPMTISLFQFGLRW